MNKYKSSKWKKKRLVILRRDGYVCQNCKRFGKSVEATIIHHIIPTEIKEEYFFDDENLISLCFSCHEKMHERHNHDLSKLGIELYERKRDKIGKV